MNQGEIISESDRDGCKGHGIRRVAALGCATRDYRASPGGVVVVQLTEKITKNPDGRFLQQLALALPLFSLVLIGYLTMRFPGWPTSVSDGLTRFVFTLALPAMLFRLMSKSRDLPPVDSRSLVAFSAVA